MAYELPTYTDFKTRFPVFVSEDNDYITALIAEAAEVVDDSWDAQDYPRAILYLVAHWVKMEKLSNAGEGVIASESFGPMSRTYVRKTDGSDYNLTPYGERYLTLRSSNFPAVFIAGPASGY